MGHSVNVITADYGKTEKEHKQAMAQLEFEANQQSEWYSDGHNGLDGKVNWLNREFDSYNEAEDFLTNHDGFYWQGGCRYRVYEKTTNKKSESLKKKAETIKEKLGKMKNDLTDYVAKNNVKNRKSVFVGCPKCGSKLHKDYIPIQYYSQNCPLCHTDLFSPTVHTRIEKFRKDINDLEKLYETTLKDAEKATQVKGKYKVRLALKYEYHC